MKADIGVVGTGVMGASLARNLARHGHKVAIFDRDTKKATQLADKHSDEGVFLPANDLEDFVTSLAVPRVALLLVPAGAPTDGAIKDLTDALDEGDIIVDMGNSHYRDTQRREAFVRDSGLHFVGCGTSGGEEGALLGPSLMPGGSKESYIRLGPMFESIAAVHDGEPCCTHIGPDGSGHYVKMVHNGIEYADMQMIAEAYQLMRDGVERNEGGKIVMIGSVQSRLARQTIAPYCASKSGLSMLTQGLTADLAKYNIQINQLSPGYFDTEMNKALVEDPEFDKWLRDRTPAGRWGEPEELIGTLLFLSSAASSFVTGQNILVDGGMTAVV